MTANRHKSPPTDVVTDGTVNLDEGCSSTLGKGTCRTTDKVPLLVGDVKFVGKSWAHVADRVVNISRKPKSATQVYSREESSSGGTLW